jgi:L-threonylcarbamoyladenylate synthase
LLNTSNKAAEVLSTETPELFQAAVARATALLRAGELVVLPTETVYGLAANAFNADAVSRIFEAKARPAHNPVIVHVASVEMARQCVSEWPPLADQLDCAFWPGPLTLVLPRAPQIPAIVTAGGPTVGIRWPSHPFMQAVIRQCCFPLAAPSANLANYLSPTTAQHVREQLGSRVQLIVDGGHCQVGIESTVLDLTTSPPRLLRPGMIHEQALLAVTGELDCRHNNSATILKSPGLLRKHYAPRAKLVVWSWDSDAELQHKTAVCGVTQSQVHVLAYDHIPGAEGFGRVSVMPHDAEAFARALYAELHQCDQAGAKFIIVEALPEKDEWRALADRLNRAAAS